MKFSYAIPFSEQKYEEQFYIYIETIWKQNFWVMGKPES